MNQVHSAQRIRGLAVVLSTIAIGGTATLAVAQNSKSGDDNPSNRQKEATRDRESARTQAIELQRASKIIGLNVVGSDGEKLGSINNLAVDPNSGHVYYVVISSGGLAGVGDTLRVAPFSGLKFSEMNKNAVLNVTKTRFDSSATFDDKGWNTIGDRPWGEKVYQYYGSEPDWNRADRKMADNAADENAALYLVKGSEIIGMDVRNKADENLGDIEDLVVNVQRGDTAYAVLSSGGVLGVGDRLYAVPFQSFNLDRTNKKMVLNIDKDRLKAAPGFDKKNWPDMADATYSKSVLSYYNATPDRVYGNVSPGRGDRDNSNASADQSRGWDLNSDYGRMIVGKSTETVSGKVAAVDFFNPNSEMSEGVQLRIKTDGSEAVNIHLGPSWYLNHQQGQFAVGDDVTVKGVRIALDGKPAIVAYEVRRDDRAMTLRHQDGTPMWDAWHATGARPDKSDKSDKSDKADKNKKNDNK